MAPCFLELHGRVRPPIRSGIPRLFCVTFHPGDNPGANPKSISQRCPSILVEFAWELTKESIKLPLGCLQGIFQSFFRDPGEHRKGGPAPTSDGVEMLEEGRDKQESEIRWLSAAGGWRQQAQAAGLGAVVALVFFSKLGAGVARPPAYPPRPTPRSFPSPNSSNSERKLESGDP